MNQLAVTQKSITILNSKGLIRKSESGAMIAIEHQVELSNKKDEFYMMETKIGKGADQKVSRSFMITAAGYDKLNQYAGLKDVPMDILRVNGQEFRNPHIVFDEKGNKQSVFQLSAVVGLGPDGKMYTSSSLIIYNAYDSFISDLLYKVRYNDNIGELAPKRVYDAKSKEDPYLEYYDVDDRVGLIVNYKNKDVNAMYSKYLEERKTAERKVKTIAKRNAMRKHPAIAAYKVVPVNKGTPEKPDWVAYVPVVQWVNVDESLFEKEIDEFMKNEESLPVENYHETEKDLDPDDEIVNDDIVDITDLSESEVLGADTEEKDERQHLIDYIVNAPVDDQLKQGLEELNILELGALKMEIDQLVINMEEHAND